MKTKLALGNLVVAFCLFLATQLTAQELGPHFKKIKDGIFTYAEKVNDPNCTIILTQDGVVLIDSGNNPPDSLAVMKAIKQLTPQPVRYLINTEPHSDHTTGHFVFSPPALIVAHQGATDSMKKAFNPKRNEKLMAESPEMRETFKGFRLITPHIEYRDKMSLNVGDRSFELYYLKNVHSESDSAIWLPKERVLFTAASVSVKRFNNLREPGAAITWARELRGVSKTLLTPSIVDAVVQKVNQKRITNSKDLRKLRTILRDPVAKAHFIADEGNIESASLRIAATEKKTKLGFVGELDAAVSAMRSMPWTELEKLKGDSELLKTIDDAKTLLDNLRKTLSS